MCPRSLAARTSPFQGGDRSSTLLEGTMEGGWLSGRALPSHGRGHRFESCFAHHSMKEFCKFSQFCYNPYKQRGRGVVVQHAGLSRRRPWVQIPSIPPIESGSSSGVEHCLAKAAVAGSNPVFRSIFIYIK